jgi:hypothetical protein
MDLEYFTHDELACPSTDEVKLGRDFGANLDALRREFGVPMRVNSCCRSKEHNESIGGHPRSLHVYDEPFHPTCGTIALDVDATIYNSGDWLRLINVAWEMGWSIGIAKTFIHLDRRIDIGLEQIIYRY